MCVCWVLTNTRKQFNKQNDATPMPLSESDDWLRVREMEKYWKLCGICLEKFDAARDRANGMCECCVCVCVCIFFSQTEKLHMKRTQNRMVNDKFTSNAIRVIRYEWRMTYTMRKNWKVNGVRWKKRNVKRVEHGEVFVRARTRWWSGWHAGKYMTLSP